MRTIKNCRILTLLCLFPLLLLTACQAGNPYNPPRTSYPHTTQSAQNPEISPFQPERQAKRHNGPPVKVAILLPLTGQHKALGQSMLNAAQMALFDASHTNLKLIPRDTQSTQAGAAQAAQSAINEGAKLILGPVFADSVRAVSPIANRARINMIAFSTDWTLAGQGLYTMGFLPFDQIQRVTEFAATRNIKRVGLLTPNTNYGRAIDNTFSKVAPRHNISITSKSAFTPHSKNLAPTMRQFTHYESRASNNALAQTPFDAVLMPAGGQDARAIGNLLSHNNLPPRKVRRLGTGLFDDPALASEHNLEGAWFAAPAPDMRQDFEQRYHQTFDAKPLRLSTLAYDATSLAAALSYSSNSNSAFSKASLNNPNGFMGIDGIFRFRPDGTAERGLAILSFQRGKIITIEDAPNSF